MTVRDITILYFLLVFIYLFFWIKIIRQREGFAGSNPAAGHLDFFFFFLGPFLQLMMSGRAVDKNKKSSKGANDLRMLKKKKLREGFFAFVKIFSIYDILPEMYIILWFYEFGLLFFKKIINVRSTWYYLL